MGGARGVWKGGAGVELSAIEFEWDLIFLSGQRFWTKVLETPGLEGAAAKLLKKRPTRLGSLTIFCTRLRSASAFNGPGPKTTP